MHDAAIDILAGTGHQPRPITASNIEPNRSITSTYASSVLAGVTVFFTALLLRGAWLALICTQHDSAELLYLAPDCARYVQIGTHLAGMEYDGPVLDWHSGPIYATPEGSMLWSGPGYGLFLGGYFALFGTQAGPVLIAQVLLGSVNCVLVWLLAGRLGLSARVAAIAGTIAALSLTSISLSCMLLTETLFFTVQLTGMLCWVRALRRNHWSWFVAAALLFGAATFVRGVTLFWPGVMLLLALLHPKRDFAGTRGALIGKTCVAVALMGTMFVGWGFRNFTRHDVFSFSEGGVLAARYFWTARTLAGFDATRNTRAMQHKMEADNRTRYGPDGATFAEHHRDDMAIFTAALREHPWPMAKRFVKSAMQNATRGSELHVFQLPQFARTWDFLRPIIHKKTGAVTLILALIGAALLIIRPDHRAAGLVLLLTYGYLCGITGFEFWQGSRICFPAQMAWAILAAVALDRALGLLIRRPSPAQF
jgi:4-amino-4-deoxy-L-arabinose transferase-like glycosyltransferase